MQVLVFFNNNFFKKIVFANGHKEFSYAMQIGNMGFIDLGVIYSILVQI